MNRLHYHRRRTKEFWRVFVCGGFHWTEWRHYDRYMRNVGGYLSMKERFEGHKSPGEFKPHERREPRF